MGFFGSLVSFVAPGVKEAFEAGNRAIHGENPLPEFNPLPGPLVSLLPESLRDGYDELKSGINDENDGLFKDLQGIRNRLHTGVEKLVRGDSSGFHDIFDAHVRGVSGAFGFAAIDLAHKASAVQVALGIEKPGRPLTQHEREVLEPVFGDSIDYSKVRIKEGEAGLFSLNDGNRPFTPGNTVYLKTSPPAEPIKGDPNKEAQQKKYDQLLVHEMTHVWQFQNFGASYIANSLGHQLLDPTRIENGTIPIWKDAGITSETPQEYNWLIGADKGLAWKDLNPEQQAHLIESAWKLGFFTHPNLHYIDAQGVDRTEYIRAAVAAVKARIG
jgi:hypothetical protein